MNIVENISIDLIKPNRHQPRTHFDDDRIIELAESIKTNGLIQPIVVRKMGNEYEIIAGERRFRACIMAGLVEVPVIIVDADELESAQMALVENIQREDLTAIEEARAYQQLVQIHGLKQTEVAKQMGKSQSAVANKLRLLKLPEEIQDAVLNREITERHARALLSVENEVQETVFKEVLNKELNVKDTENLINKVKQPKESKRKPVTKGYSQNHRIAINTIKQAVDMTSKFGIESTLDQFEDDDEITMVIKFKK